jgi:hypothetical protein
MDKILKINSIYNISCLCQVIIDYLQYHEAVVLQPYLNFRPPNRPVLYLKDIPETMSFAPPKNMEQLERIRFASSQPDNSIWIFFPNIERWYISYDKDDDLYLDNEKLGYIISHVPAGVEVFWQCPDCLLYRKIVFREENNISYIKGYILEQIDLSTEIHYLCDCSARKYIERDKYILKEKFLHASTTISYNNYLSAGKFNRNKYVNPTADMMKKIGRVKDNY